MGNNVKIIPAHESTQEQSVDLHAFLTTRSRGFLHETIGADFQHAAPPRVVSCSPFDLQLVELYSW